MSLDWDAYYIELSNILKFQIALLKFNEEMQETGIAERVRPILFTNSVASEKPVRGISLGGVKTYWVDADATCEQFVAYAINRYVKDMIKSFEISTGEKFTEYEPYDNAIRWRTWLKSWFKVMNAAYLEAASSKGKGKH